VGVKSTRRRAAGRAVQDTSNRTVLKVRMGSRLDGGVIPHVARGARIFRESGGWVYIAGNRQGLKALYYALGRVLRSRTVEIFEGPGYTVIYDRHQ